ncbi:MAG TPA: YfhO family protein [Rhodanobacteraceae bacterium]|nr:YfhO family protein [Rhodanobacteraceae bacterium]
MMVTNHPSGQRNPGAAIPRNSSTGERLRSLDEGKRGFLLYLACAIVIVLVLSLYFIIKHRAFAFVDIGIDTFSYYFPFQIAHARQLHELHTMTWSFDAGLGSYIGWLSNALVWLNALFPESWQLGLRLPTYFLRVLLAGGFMYGYLRKIGIEARISAAGALAYAFCGYAMVNGQWDTQGYAIPQLAAYLFFFECYFRNRKARYAVLAGLVVGSGAVFDTYTFTLLSVLYVVARPFLVSREDDAAPYLPSLCRYIAWAALGAMLTAVVLVPNLIYLLSSPRVSGNHSIFHSVLDSAGETTGFRLLAVELLSLFGKSMFGTASNYHGWSNWFEAPGFYVGILMLVCIPQLLGPKATRRERLMCIAGLVLWLVYITWPFMRHAVYGFGHLGFRLSTLWVSLGLLVLGVAGLRRVYRSGTWRSGLLMTIAGMVLVLLYLTIRRAHFVDFEHLALVLTFIAMYGALLWPSPSRQGMPWIPATGLVFVLACELLIFAIPPILHRHSVAMDGSSRVGSYHDGTGDALRWIRKREPENAFYRVEKTYRSVYLNDSLVQDYSGTKSYFFQGKSITRFVDKMQLPRPHPRTNYIGRMTGRPAVLDLLGVRYLLSRNRGPDKLDGMTWIGSAGKINIYRNRDAHGIGHLYRNLASEAEADKLPVTKRDALLLDTVIVPDPAEVQAGLARLDREHPRPVAGTEAQASLRKISDIHLAASVHAPQASVFLISMPFERGWQAQVDGKVAPMFRADYGLTALLLAPGQHEVALRYAVPGRALGKWLSLAALLILIGCGAIRMIAVRQRGGRREGEVV